MSNILIYPRDRRPEGRSQEPPAAGAAPHIDIYGDPLMGLGWLVAAVGLLCMVSAIALATLNLA